MNAIKFIQQHGVDAARIVIGSAEIGEIQTPNVRDLKLLVSSVDIVEESGGVERCKLLYFNSPFKRDNHIKRLKQAIADYESIYSGEQNV